MPGAVQDVITPANLGEDRLRGFGVARGRMLAFSIHLLRRLYRALPCENDLLKVVYREPVIGPRFPGIVHRQSAINDKLAVKHAPKPTHKPNSNPTLSPP